jgi:hypothetical protein
LVRPNQKRQAAAVPAAAPAVAAVPVRFAEADGAAQLVAWGLVLYLLLPANLLVTVGYPYDVPYGAFPAKIHPGTYVIGLGFLSLVFGGNPIRRLTTLAQLERAGVAFLLGGIAVLVLSVVRYGTSGTAFIIDTFIATAMVTLVLRAAGDRWCRFCFHLVVIAVAINALIGFLQSFGHWRLVPYMAGDLILTEDYFRANALGGHPLSNAFRTAVVVLALPVLGGRLKVAGLMGLMMLALLAFGGRTALVVAVVLLGGWGAVRLGRGVVGKTLHSHIVILIALGAPVVASAVIGVLAASNIASRIIGTLYWDDSAESRVLVFRIFDYLDNSRLILGIGPDDIEKLLFYLRSSTSLYYIENTWILLLLQFGVVGMLLLVPAMFALFITAAARGGTAGWLVTIAVLVIVSSNNALASKTQNLALVMPVLLGIASLEAERRRNGGSARLLPFARGSLVPAAWQRPVRQPAAAAPGSIGQHHDTGINRRPDAHA